MTGAFLVECTSMITTHQLTNQSRRLDRLNAKVAEVLASMQAGSTLLLAYGSGGLTWRLSTGRYVAPEVARLVIKHPNIIGVGDTLPIIGAPSQTWRCAEVQP